MTAGDRARRRSSEPPTSRSTRRSLRRRARGGCAASFDARWGGFGGAPKFPQPMTLEFLLRDGTCAATPGALEMLDADARPHGARRDLRPARRRLHAVLDGRRAGTSRTSRRCSTTTRSSRGSTPAPGRSPARSRYRDVAVETLDYLLREMRQPEGGFFSSQDADTEGVEGGSSCGRGTSCRRSSAKPVAAAFGAAPGGQLGGRRTSCGSVAIGRRGSPRRRARQRAPRWSCGGRNGGDARCSRPGARVHPAIDDKVLAAWNGLAIAALRRGRARASTNPGTSKPPSRAAAFVLSTCATRRAAAALVAGRAGGRPGFADDHALLAGACLTLYETTFDLRWFAAARALADDLVRLFSDEERGGFFQTGTDAEQLVVRPKDLYDNAVPAGTRRRRRCSCGSRCSPGTPAYERRGSGAPARPRRDGRAPTAFGQALVRPRPVPSARSKEIAIVGEPEARPRALAAGRPGAIPAERRARGRRAGDATRPRRCRCWPAGRSVDGRPAAYVCERFVCRLPVTAPDDLRRQLDPEGS